MMYNNDELTVKINYLNSNVDGQFRPRFDMPCTKDALETTIAMPECYGDYCSITSKIKVRYDGFYATWAKLIVEYPKDSSYEQSTFEINLAIFPEIRHHTLDLQEISATQFDKYPAAYG